MNSVLWKIGGEAGFGIMTVGLSFDKIATRSGYYIFDYPEYPSLIRGGHNTYEVHISEEPVNATKWDVDFLVCLNRETYLHHMHRLTDKSVVIYDADEFTILENNFTKLHVPFRKFKKEHTAMQVMVNTIAIGASLAAMDGDIDAFYKILEDEFGKKGPEVLEYNKKFAILGYDYIRNNYPDKIRSVLKKREGKKQVVMTGNDAFAFASAAADCRLYVAYPMTPSSSVLATVAAWQMKTGMVVRHAEDEIAVINSALGGSNAGVRASVGTSGGGFALMVEALSFAGVAEIPIVVYLAQRPGPATGLPTWTEQGDLLFAVNAGHGEYPKIVLAPGDLHEMVELSLKAYDLADIYQTPVIVMSDKLIGESHMSYDHDAIQALANNYQPNYGKKIAETKEEKYLRYKWSDDGISERLIPGQKGQFYQANSYSHLEDSHTTEEADPRKEQVDKLNRKTTTYLANHFQPPQVFGNLDEADKVIVSWGGNKGTIIDAMKTLEAQGQKVAYIHFTHLFPMDREKVKPFFNKEGKKYMLLENNAHAQFGSLLLYQTGVEIQDKILKYDGRPFWPEEIVREVSKR
jgi:2-oxoglutarate ferredoxin oxidoreductase subunit alpha